MIIDVVNFHFINQKIKSYDMEIRSQQNSAERKGKEGRGEEGGRQKRKEGERRLINLGK